MENGNEKVIDKIKKLLALAESDNENESKVCLLKAQRLMLENNINMSEVDKKDKKVVHKPVLQSGRVKWYEKALSSIIAENFKCFVYLKKQYRSSVITFIGIDNEAEIAYDTFHYALKSMEHNADRYVYFKYDKVGIKNDYIQGFLKGLQESFKKQVESNCLAIVLRADPEVQKERDNMRLRKGARSSIRSGTDAQARNDGYNKGKSFSRPTAAIR